LMSFATSSTEGISAISYLIDLL